MLPLGNSFPSCKIDACMHGIHGARRLDARDQKKRSRKIHPFSCRLFHAAELIYGCFNLHKGDDCESSRCFCLLLCFVDKKCLTPVVVSIDLDVFCYDCHCYILCFGSISFAYCCSRLADRDEPLLSFSPFVQLLLLIARDSAGSRVRFVDRRCQLGVWER